MAIRFQTLLDVSIYVFYCLLLFYFLFSFLNLTLLYQHMSPIAMIAIYRTNEYLYEHYYLAERLCSYGHVFEGSISPLQLILSAMKLFRLIIKNARPHVHEQMD